RLAELGRERGVGIERRERADEVAGLEQVDEAPTLAAGLGLAEAGRARARDELVREGELRRARSRAPEREVPRVERVREERRRAEPARDREPLGGGRGDARARPAVVEHARERRQ